MKERRGICQSARIEKNVKRITERIRPSSWNFRKLVNSPPFRIIPVSSHLLSLAFFLLVSPFRRWVRRNRKRPPPISVPFEAYSSASVSTTAPIVDCQHRRIEYDSHHIRSTRCVNHIYFARWFFSFTPCAGNWFADRNERPNTIIRRFLFLPDVVGMTSLDRNYWELINLLFVLPGLYLNILKYTYT